MFWGNYLKNYIQVPIDIGVCGVNLRAPTRIVFSRAEGVPKGRENTW